MFKVKYHFCIQGLKKIPLPFVRKQPKKMLEFPGKWQTDVPDNSQLSSWSRLEQEDWRLQEGCLQGKEK